MASVVRHFVLGLVDLEADLESSVGFDSTADFDKETVGSSDPEPVEDGQDPYLDGFHAAPDHSEMTVDQFDCDSWWQVAYSDVQSCCGADLNCDSCVDGVEDDSSAFAYDLDYESDDIDLDNDGDDPFDVSNMLRVARLVE